MYHFMPDSRRNAILLLGGANLVLLQFIALRTFPAVMLELIVFLVILAYFTGCSAGYFLSNRVGPKGLRIYAALQWVTQLTMPFSIRWIAGKLASARWDKTALLVMLFLGTFWACSFYSVLLPTFLTSRKNNSDSDFVQCYRLEIAGALLGLLLVSAMTPVDSRFIMTMYEGILTAILCLIFWDARILLAGGVALLSYALAFPLLSQASIAYFHKIASGIEVSRVLLESESRYQHIELLEDGRFRYLFLDGFAHYAPHQDTFNYFVAGLPVGLLPAPDVAVVGSGSFGAAKDALASARSVTSVELDPAVAAAGRKWLARPFTPDELKKWTLVIDDAKHYFANTDRHFDLISLDIAGPFQRQVSMLYTIEFLKVLDARLKAGGVVSMSLFGNFERRRPLTMSMVRSLLDVFSRVYVVVLTDQAHPSIKSFALAGDSPPFGKTDIEDRLRRAGWRDVRVYDRSDILRFWDSRYEALSIKNMSPTLLCSIHRIMPGRFFSGLRERE